MNYFQMAMQKPSTKTQIEGMIPKIAGIHGAKYLLRKAGKLEKNTARIIAGKIETQAGSSNFSQRQREKIIKESREFRNRLI
ncbi:MAG: hypothetical protein NTX79_00720 [Candidatus Micrarchaeota archaeon]|nr:hypothetical protein [Candidatus Micrarchaeota archaeon]